MKINNKSSSSITPESFNPWINYKAKENKANNKKMIPTSRNNDHFYHMNPTELHKYKPLVKRNKINYHSFSQIESLPGNTIKYDLNGRKKSGKKLFNLKNLESKEKLNRNQCKNDFIFLHNLANMFCKNSFKI